MGKEARETTQWSEREFVRNRYDNFLGGTAPATIAAKEIVDNCTDQISDKKTNFGYFEIGKDFHSLTSIDGGKGISTRQTVRIDTKEKSTFMYLAVAKMYNSTNYDDEKNAASTVGRNGVGTKLNNFCSKNFTVGVVKSISPKGKKVIADNEIYNSPNCSILGYHFKDGVATIDGTTMMNQAIPELIDISCPMFYGQTEPFGYFVHAEYDTSIFGDEIDEKWLRNYAVNKFAQSQIGENETLYFTFKSYDKEGNENCVTYVKTTEEGFEEKHLADIESGKIEIVNGWETIANKIVEENQGDAWLVKSGFFTVLVANDPKILEGICNIAQGAPVENLKSFPYKFTVGHNDISVPIFCAFNLCAKNARGLTYSDQTKKKLASNRATPANLHINNLVKAFEHCPEAKAFFESEANKKALGKGRIHSSSYWPATGGMTARQLYESNITEEDIPMLIKRVKNDPDALEYAKSKGIDIEKLIKSIA